VPLRARRVIVKSLDFSGVKGLGDFSSEEAEKILRREAVMQEQAALVVANHDPNRFGAIYASSIDTAEAVRTIIETRHGVPCALVHSRMSDADRKHELARFEKGEARLIANVAVLTMGWDSRRCSELHLLKPTLSLPRYIQIVGRSIRPLPGCADQPTEYLRRLAIAQSEKPDAVIIDYTDTTKFHRVCSAIDVMLPPKSRKYRERLIDRAGEQDVKAEDLEKVVIEIDAEIKAEEKAERDRVLAEIQAEKTRRSQLVVGVTFDAQSVDPFAKPTASNPRRREPRMLWGPYRGQPIRTIPPSDLKRILKSMRKSPGNEWLYKAIRREIDKLARAT
jgi:superfamily II DNA/RNA helicase